MDRGKLVAMSPNSRDFLLAVCIGAFEDEIMHGGDCRDFLIQFLLETTSVFRRGTMEFSTSVSLYCWPRKNNLNDKIPTLRGSLPARN